MMRLLFFVLVCSFPVSTAFSRPAPGIYRGVLTLNASGDLELPFSFELRYKGRKPQITIMNADERIVVTEINIKGDSVNFRMPVFDTEFRTVATAQGFDGVWINHYRKNERVLKFRATRGDSGRFRRPTHPATTRIEGRWRCVFSAGTKQETPAVAIFHHIEQTNNVSGTFLTETGDYRYLEGVVSGDTLLLSAFDGSRAYLFTAMVRNDSLVKGMFYSGSHWQEPFSGVRDEGYTLRDPKSITGLRDTAATIGFSFPDTKGKVVSLSDRKFRDKPVIVQLMGSWCANCMDESRYLAELYSNYKKQGLEIVALAYEKTNDREKALKQVKRMKERLELPYDVLITGATGKDEAGRTMPQLSGVTAFPTTLFLDRNHRVVRIFTGFSGPATGTEYEKFRNETAELINRLLKT